MNRLEEILCVKRAEVQRLLPRRKELQRLAEVEGEYRGFRAALKRRDEQIAIIAEIKKASPSSGLIAEPFDPIGIAENYERSGAEAISVLTDQTFFQGSLTDLIDVRRHVSLPILRKDLQAFVISPISPHTLSNRPVVDAASRVYELLVPRPHAGTTLVVDGRVLLDGGAPLLPHMHRLGVDPGGIEAVFLTHFHGGGR